MKKKDVIKKASRFLKKHAFGIGADNTIKIFVRKRLQHMMDGKHLYGYDAGHDSLKHFCFPNQLEEKAKACDCSENLLEDLEVHKGLKYLDCSNNFLKHLELPEGLLYLDCSNNLMESISIPSSLIYLKCDNIYIIGDLKEIEIEIETGGGEDFTSAERPDNVWEIEPF